MIFNIPFRIIFSQELDNWIAHCLEFDLLGSGNTKEKALQDLIEVIILQLKVSMEYNNPSNFFSVAPNKFFQKFTSEADIAIGNLIIICCNL